ncbi:MAG: GNAT family N-acetyltransferase [Acidobacteria bacterium]|nr:GNAT family N-acetyltransferase [Acidobacteriota bacterium]
MERALKLPGPDNTDLVALRSDDAPALYAAISEHRAALDPWLRWSAAITSESEAEAFIEGFIRRERLDEGFHLGLWDADALCGGVVCWSIDPAHHVAELGYWLTPDSRRRGLARRATQRVVDYLFGRGVNRIEFQCRVENAPSRRVAEGVGGILEGVRRQSHLVGGSFRDHAVYAVLRSDRVDTRDA